MTTVLAVICIALMVLSLMLLFLSLPGNWVILGIAALWSFFGPEPLSWNILIVLLVMAIVGEVLEFFAGTVVAKHFGGSSKGSVGGIIGAIVGAILCAPLFFGFGALLGALGGAFIGSFSVEKLTGMETKAAVNAATGTTLGRLGGFFIKLGLGVSMIILAAPRIWDTLG